MSASAERYHLTAAGERALRAYKAERLAEAVLRSLRGTAAADASERAEIAAEEAA